MPLIESERMPGRYILDAYALLAFFFEQPGAAEVEEVLSELANELLVSAINLGEVSYIVQRRRGTAARDRALERLFAQPNMDVVDVTWSRIRSAADIKAGGRVSYADAFAAGLALERQGRLVTGDAEFERLEQRLGLDILWLPRQ